jgi:hypothetical protein
LPVTRLEIKGLEETCAVQLATLVLEIKDTHTLLSLWSRDYRIIYIIHPIQGLLRFILTCGPTSGGIHA